MPITYHSAERIFHLRSHDISYVLKILPSGLVAHLYFGLRLRSDSLTSLLTHFDKRYPKDVHRSDFVGMLDLLPQEYPTYGLSDFRAPALEVRNADGSSLVDLRYDSHEISPGKPPLSGLPATYVEDSAEADSLDLTLADTVSGLEVHLLYTGFRDHAAIARSVRIVNRGGAALRLERALSLSIDLKLSGWDVVSLSGSWARERRYQRQNVASGTFSIETREVHRAINRARFSRWYGPTRTKSTGRSTDFR